MNSMEAFIGLLVLAFLGNILVGGRSVRGYGLPSGSEYLVLGVFLGPSGFRWLARDTMVLFDPMLQVGVGWLALIMGLGWGVMEAKQQRWSTLTVSFAGSLFSCALVGLSVYLAARHFTALPQGDCVVLAAASGAIGTETTRIAVRWVVERHDANGPLGQWLSALSDSDEMPALLVLAALFCWVPRPEALHVQAPPLVWLLATLGLGILLGLVCVALIGDQLHRGEALTFVLGAALLGTGLCVQLGLSTITVLFATGLTLSAGSRHRVELRALLAKSEAPVMLPVLLLAGAHLDFVTVGQAPWIVVAALGARLLAKWSMGLGLLVRPVARPAGAWLGLALLPSGVLTISIGIAVYLRVGGTVGRLALAVAAAMALFGEMLGPYFLKRALTRAGEIVPAESRAARTTPVQVEPGAVS